MPVIRTRRGPSLDPQIVSKTLEDACRALKPMSGEEVEAYLSGVMAALQSRAIIRRWSINKSINFLYTLTWYMTDDVEMYMMNINATIAP